jgi:hypothetical protein
MPGAAWSGPRFGRRAPFLLAVALSTVFFVLALEASVGQSLTWDEPSFISAGYAYLTRGEFRFNPSHPPLLQALEAAPLLPMDLRVPSGSWEFWQARSGNAVLNFGYTLIFDSGNDPHRIAFWARLPVLVLGATLVMAVYLWGRSLHGPWPALTGAALCASCPNLIAHSGLATEDLGCTTLMFLAAWAFWRADRGGGTWRWALCGLLTGLSFASKYTALLLAPVFFVSAAASLLGRLSPRSWTAWARALLVVGGVSALVVAAAYGPRLGFVPYWRGLTLIYGDLRPGYEYYLAGSFSQSGWWYYALAAFAFKVSAATLLLLVGAMAVPAGGMDARRDTLLVLAPPAAVLLASCFDPANLGLRRILPAFPFLYLFASRFAASSAGARLRPVRLAGLVLLLGATGAETARVHPHELSFVSAAAGGPLRGPWLLDDSNIDWGQDLPALARWQRSHPEAGPMTLAYFGSAAPAAYGVHATGLRGPADLLSPRPGTYAISVSLLVRFRRLAATYGPDLDWLSRFEPVARAGYSIYIYRFPGPPRPPPLRPS